MMKRIVLKWYLVLLLIGLAGIPLVSAVTIDISPHQVAPGDLITVTTTGLKDGSNVSMKLVAVINEPTAAYKMDIGNLYFPINLDEASFTITNQNTGTNTVNLINYIPSIGYTFITIGGPSVDNRWSGEISGEGRNDINGTFQLIRVAGNKYLGSEPPVISSMEWNGIKKASEGQIPDQVDGGPEDFSMVFSQNGVNSGSIELTILVNGTMVASDKVIIGRSVNVIQESSPATGYLNYNQAYLVPSFAQVINPRQLPVFSEIKGQIFTPTFMTNSGAGNSGVFSSFTIPTVPSYTGKLAKLS